MDNRALWRMMQEITSAIYPHFKPVIDRFVAGAGWDAGTWGALLGALTFEPEAVTAARLQMRTPYAAANGVLERLAPALEKGYMTEPSQGEYRLTETGRTETQRFIEQIRAAMAAADPLSRADSERLAGLLRRLMGVSLAAPPPPNTHSIRLSLKLVPSLNPPLPYTEQAISCLSAYRDDAYVAAWQPSGLSAPALETLTLLWRAEADSLDVVCASLAQRRHPRQVYADALAELRERELVTGTDDALGVSDAGRRFRDNIERETDRYFFGPWASLNHAEKNVLGDLLTGLLRGLRAGSS